MAQAVELKVHLMSYTPDAERICAAAARQCYTIDDAVSIVDQLTEEQIIGTLKHCIRSGHLAVLANAHAVIAVNVTRECLTQLNTHAWVKTLTQSQQYCDHAARGVRYHIPEAFANDTEAIARFMRAMDRDEEDYIWFRQRGYEPMDARAVLSNAAEANTVLSGNLWGWFEWISRRICKRNTPVTLDVAQQILAIFRLKWPRIFAYCGAPCWIDKCREQKPCKSGPYRR